METQPIPIDNPATPFASRSRRDIDLHTQMRQDLQQTSTAAVLLVSLPRPIEGSSGAECLMQLRFDSPEAFLLMYGINTETSVSAALLGAIDELKAGKEDETVPTDYAYQEARRTIESAYATLRSQGNVPTVEPEPWATTDDVGGIRVLWNVRSKKLRANFGARPELATYLYYESDLEHDAEPLNAATLKGRLSWLTH